MPRLRIDDREIEVPAGTTVLDAALQLDIDIPTLCYLPGCQPNPSCLACVVRLNGQQRLAPACATMVGEGMSVESESKPVIEARRVAIELLLSDHAGDCIAPCQRTCPAHMNIPLMTRQIAAGQLQEALATVREHIALPAVLGRICSAPCENGCRRGKYDQPLSIQSLERNAADISSGAGDACLPRRQPPTGKRVAVIGSGPTGLAAAFYLSLAGHDCTVFDNRPLPGGMLRYGTSEAELPRDILGQEISTIERLGVAFHLNTRLGQDLSLQELQSDFAAVILAVGQIEKTEAARWGLRTSRSGIQINPITHETSLPGIFAGGDAVQPRRLAARSVGHGRIIARSVNQLLSGSPVTGENKVFTSVMGRITNEELACFKAVADAGGRVERGEESASARNHSHSEGVEEALRCFHCDCRAVDTCKLRHYAQRYEANTQAYQGERRAFQHCVHPNGLIYEPGKCISCGLCVRIAAAEREPLGLAFLGRGFKARVGVPFSEDIAEGLQNASSLCVEACPTGALVFREESPDLRTKTIPL